MYWGSIDDTVKIMSWGSRNNITGSGYQWVLSPNGINNRLVSGLVNSVNVTTAAKVLKGVLSVSPYMNTTNPHYQKALNLWQQQPNTLGRSGSCLTTTDDNPQNPTYLYQEDHDDNKTTPNLCAGSTFTKDNFGPQVYTYDAVIVLANSIHELIYNLGRIPCSINQYQSSTKRRDCFTGNDLLNMTSNFVLQSASGLVSFENGSLSYNNSKYFIYSHNGSISNGSLGPFIWVGSVSENQVVRCSQLLSVDLACNIMIWPNGDIGIENPPQFSEKRRWRNESNTTIIENNKSGLDIKIVLAIALSLGMLIVIIVVSALWVFSSNFRKLRRLNSNENIATKCAEAIAKLDFSTVAFLDTIENPNRIQKAFIRIVEILKEIKGFVPDAVLQNLANETDDISLGASIPDVLDKYEQREHSNELLLSRKYTSQVEVQELTSAQSFREPGVPKLVKTASRLSKLSSSSIRSARSIRSIRRSPMTKLPPVPFSSIITSTWTKKKTTILCLKFEFVDVGLGDSLTMRDILTDVLSIFVVAVKQKLGTVDQISSHSAWAFWASPSTLLACEVALMIHQQINSIKNAQRVKWCIGIAHDSCYSGPINAGPMSAMIVMGEPVWMANELARQSRVEQLNLMIPILTDLRVQQGAVYSYLFKAADLVKPPNRKTQQGIYQLTGTRHASENEWMYQIGSQSEERDDYEEAFNFAAKGETEEAKIRISRYLQRNPDDVCAKVLLSQLSS
eukprot:NODE_494_length_2674_cov_10.173265_g425_i0.p1 GENE.NODE_494_length_2674_cov_10.173265_g425_i0~~NODE_494_length_2674_cov_10.173265_g425_i0.p1  ORF type:complete len:805 (+),score=165.91 NODE_494_length_2674_cov_10.173265_g425_i0:215-2416(+)